MKKRIVAALLILCLVVNIVPALAIGEVMVSQDRWLYRVLQDGTAELTGTTDLEAVNLTLPEQVNGYWVTGLSEDAFGGMPQLKQVSIPACISCVPISAFADSMDMTVSAYNGTAALAFAGARGLQETNLSEYDLFAHILDLSDMSASQWSMTNDVVSISMPYSALIYAGETIYLPPRGEYAAGRPVEILSVEESDGTAVASVRALSFEEAVESYHLENEPLYIDHDNIRVISPYVTMETNRKSRSTANVTGNNTFSFHIDNLPLPGGLYLKGEFAETVTTTISLDYQSFQINSMDIDMDLERTLTGTIHNDPSKFIRSEKNSFTLAEIPLASLAGVVNLVAELTLNVSIEGEVTFNLLYSEQIDLLYSGGKISQNASSGKRDVDFSAAVAGSVGVEAALKGKLGFGPVSMEFLRFAVRAELVAKAEYASDRPECIDLAADLVITLDCRAGVIADAGDGIDYSIGGSYSTSLSLGNWHYETSKGFVDECSYVDSYIVRFITNYGESIQDQEVKKGSTATEPNISSTSTYTVFQGWFSDPVFSNAWDFSTKITRNTILYAKWVRGEKTVLEYPETDKQYDGFSYDPSDPKRNEVIYSPIYLLDDDFNRILDANRQPIKIGYRAGGRENMTYAHIKAEPYGDGLKVISVGPMIWGHLPGGDGYTCGGFEDCEALRKVIIPDSVEVITEDAFKCCSQLEEVTIPSSVKKIEDYAFWECESLRSIRIPNSVTEIGYGAFCGCSSLTEIYIPASVKKIADNAFSGCTALVSVVIEGAVQIGDGSLHYGGAFENCAALIDVKLPETLKKIGIGSFEGCTSLAHITIPDSVTEICDYAFSECFSLTSIQLSQSLQSIGARAFERCESLLNIKIPDSTVSIGYRAFIQCDSLQNVTLSRSLTNIKESVFYHCYSLQSIDIPASVKSIGEKAFEYCKSLYQVTLHEGLEKIEIGDFYGCSSLLSIAIPSTMTYIAHNSFGACDSLASFTFSKSMNGLKEISLSLESLGSLTIPNGMESVYLGYGGFLETLVVPDSVTELSVSKSSGSYHPITVYVESMNSYAANYFKDEQYFTVVLLGSENEPLSVAFNSMGGSSVKSQSLKRNARITRPDIPQKTGYSFTGWFTEPECIYTWNFESPVTEDIVLYAGWRLSADCFIYSGDSTGVKITGFTGTEPVMTIPETINGNPVTALSDGVVSSIVNELTLEGNPEITSGAVFQYASNLTTIHAKGTRYTAPQNVALVRDGDALVFLSRRSN